MPDTPAVRRADLVGSKIGRFVVLAQLGQGGMGEVFKAKDTKLNRTVALKRLHVPDHNTGARSRLLSEAERASRVNHPNIATVYDVIEEGDDVLLVMEYVEGETLRHRLYRSMPVDEAIRIASQCADALAAAHKQGVIHCDIKPENVMLTAEGGVKLLDFGVARTIATPDNATWASRTNTNAFSGTPAYMSPEVLNEQPPDGRSDIFSLGVVLYEMLAGENPFQSGIMIETANQVLHRDPPALGKLRPEVPEQVDRIVSHAIEKAPRERYESATLMANDLRAIVSGQAHLVAAPLHRRKRRYLEYLAPAIAAVVVLAVAVGLWLLLRRPSSTIPQTRLVAVLPFTVNADDRSAQAFSDGLVETLTAKLSRISDGQSLQVIPAWEVRSQKVTTAEEAVKTLGVNMVVEGSLRQSDKNVRVTYALVDPSTHRQLHGDSITAVMSNPFAVEDRVVDSVLSSLQVELRPQQREALNAGRPTEPGAYDFYLQGRGYLQDYHKPENVDNAITVFQRSLQADPKFALAYAGLGEAYWTQYNRLRDPKMLTKAQESCRQAATLSPTSAAGRICLGTIYNTIGHYEDAVQQFRQATQLADSTERAWFGLGRALESSKHPAEAEQAFQRAVADHPSYWGAYNQLGAFYFRNGRYQDALVAFRRVTELTPDNFRAYSNLGGVLVSTGDYAKAIEVTSKSTSMRPSSSAYSILASAYFFEHRFDESIANAQKAVDIEPGKYELWCNLAEAYYWAGRRKQDTPALTMAREAVDKQLRINDRDPLAMSVSAYLSAMKDDRASARVMLQRALGSGTTDPDVLARAAVIYQMVGDTTQALDAAGRAVKAGATPSLLRDHPAFSELKSDPRLTSLLTK